MFEYNCECEGGHEPGAARYSRRGALVREQTAPERQTRRRSNSEPLPGSYRSKHASRRSCVPRLRPCGKVVKTLASRSVDAVAESGGGAAVVRTANRV